MTRRSPIIIGLVFAAVLAGNSPSPWSLVADEGSPNRPERSAPFVQGDWPAGWSGLRAKVEAVPGLRTPDGEPGLRFRWTRTEDQTLPSIGRSFAATALRGDVVCFWMRVDRPVERLQVILTDGDDVGAEQSVPGLLNVPRVEPGRWHFVAWPFQVNPGWVRYRRGQVDWQKIKSISLYTWNDQLHPEVAVELGPFHVLRYPQLEAVFQKHPDRVSNNRSLPWRVLAGKRADLMMVDYHQRRAEEKLARLRAQYPPDRFRRSEEQIRKALAATYLMPADPGTVPEATLLRTVELDGLRVEHLLLKVRDGVYSTALLFLPSSSDGRLSRRRAAILMLPGHGDPSWSPAVQNRCLSFAKRGYVVLLVQPFGQGERGENAAWNEGHGSQATAYLLTTGQSLLGLIMADHEAELSYLRSRAEVDPEKVGVTGVSMGGTHSLWLSAIDRRVKAAVAVAAAALYQPNASFRHHCLCDLMVGVYDVADMEMIQSLTAPRALLHIYPSTERPVSAEAMRLSLEGWMGHEEALSRRRLDDPQIARLHQYTHDVFAAAGVPERYRHLVIEGPHDYTKTMREAAAGWFGRYLRGDKDDGPVPEAALSPLAKRPEAVAALNHWPKGNRPPEVLSPAAYVQMEVAALLAKLPAAPSRKEDWAALCERLRGDVKSLLGEEATSAAGKVREVGQARSEKGAIHQLVVEPEPGIELPLLLFAPADGMPADGRLVVLLHPAGMMLTAGSAVRQQLTREGAWVLCVDLRGMGETRSSQESGGYLGFRDLDIAMGALKLGDTLAGYWTRDLLAAIRGAKEVVKTNLKVTVRGEQETGLVAVLAAGQSRAIDAVETRGLLASCQSAQGYGLPFAYSDENNNKSVRGRKLGGYGSMVPCIPRLLQHADIPQLAALVAPRPLAIEDPLWASGNSLAESERARAFAWTRDVYRLVGAEGSFHVGAKAVR